MKIVCDIDGVLFDSTPQINRYLVQSIINPEPQWSVYYKEIPRFSPIQPIISVVRALNTHNNKITFLSGRPTYTAIDTLHQLDKAGLPTYDVVLRPPSFQGDSYKFKLGIILSIQPQLIIEDEPRAADAFMKAGFLVLQVRGTRVTDEDRIPPAVI